MTSKLADSLRKLQEYIFEVGLARSVLALPAPRMLSLPSPTSDEAMAGNVFVLTVVEPEIVDVARDLFVSGHYALAVQEAYKVVDKLVASLAGRKGLHGTALMDSVFGPKAPILVWTERQNQSEQDEQSGYHRLFSGAMLGIRNPVTHEIKWIDDADVALELLVFAQHLIRKAKAAKISQP
jgi:uncharacterized protein (TIGR02391 family)